MENLETSKLMEQLKRDPKAKEVREQIRNAGDEEEKITLLISFAKELGYDLTREDLQTYIREETERLAKKTDAQSDVIQRLNDDEVANVAGGKHYNSTDRCQDTYLDKENCWITDGCDNDVIMYPSYKCDWYNAGQSCSWLMF